MTSTEMIINLAHRPFRTHEHSGFNLINFLLKAAVSKVTTAIQKFVLTVLILHLSTSQAWSAPPITAITPTTGNGDLGTTVTQGGRNFAITGGTRPGNGTNLFHSFGSFSVGAGDIANFQNDP